MLADNFRELIDVMGILLVAFGSTLKVLVGTGIVISNLIARIKEFTGGTKEATEEVQKLSDVLSGADANDGFVEPLESALQIIHDFEHELSVGVPTATEKAISKFRELNSGAIKNLEDKFKDLQKVVQYLKDNQS
jgi:hypothetical protein